MLPHLAGLIHAGDKTLKSGIYNIVNAIWDIFMKNRYFEFTSFYNERDNKFLSPINCGLSILGEYFIRKKSNVEIWEIRLF